MVKNHSSTATNAIPATGPTTAPAIQLLLDESESWADGVFVTTEDGVSPALVLLEAVEDSNAELEAPALRLRSDDLDPQA
jgi:hypothetical protein